MRILVIEDDAETAAYVVGGLRKSGQIADQVSDGRERLVTAANGGYDVLVVDRMLPGVDGAQRRPSGNENDVAREGLGIPF